jgi:hypothetical protein
MRNRESSTSGAPPNAQSVAIGADAEEQIRLRAYQFSQDRNGSPGDPTEDWLNAEREYYAVGSSGVGEAGSEPARER